MDRSQSGGKGTLPRKWNARVESDLQEMRKVLSMEVDGGTESEYRIQVNNQVKYIVVQPGLYDLDEVLSFPPALLENLPTFPPGNWTSMNVARGADGTPTRTTCSRPLAAVTRIWHPEKIDVLGLKETERFGARVRIFDWEGREVVTKTARFDFELRLVKSKTKPAYMRNSTKSKSNIRISQRYLLLSLAIS